MSKIVAIEDERVLAKALSVELLSAGFTVVTAEDGAAGLALIKAELPDLVLLDLVLPKMSGFDVLQAVKADPKTKNIPVIILSNLGQDEDRTKGLALGAVDYYVKSSTDLEVLTEKIKQLLKQGS